MNILFITDDFPPYNQGGAGISTSLFVKYFSKKHRCYVFTMKCNKKRWFFHKVPVFAVLQKAESENKSIKEVISFGTRIIQKVFLDFITTREFVKSNHIDLVNIVATNYFSALQIIAVFFMGKPVIVDVRDLSLFRTLSYLNIYRTSPRKRTLALRAFLKVFTFLEKLFFEMETGILRSISSSGASKIQYVALSKYIKQELVKFGYPKSRITVINNISEIYTNEKPLKEKQNQIVYAGRIESEKGIWTVINAWELINDPLLRLLIIGKGSMLSELKKYVKSKRIKNVTFLGRVTSQEVVKQYSNSKIIVAPSIWPEPFGRFILESIASKTPLITTRVGGITEGIKHRKTGILVTVNNPMQLAKAVIELLNNKKLYNKIVKNLEREPDRYSPEKIVTKRQNLYSNFI